ncbi:MAG: hypothetical protein JW703_05230 [Candidatus Diapherotrites archaeon]|nr:hypothetical protein [Candidatus Diapherotrites archaeon]
MNKILIISLLAMILVLGCTSAPPQNPNEQIPNQNNQNNQIPNQQNNMQEQNNNQEQNQNENNALNDFLGSMGTATEYKVIYDVTSSYSGYSSTSVYGYYIKGNKMRMDTTIDNTKSMMFFLEGTTYMCSDSGTELTCMDLGSESSTDSYTGMLTVDKDTIEDNMNDYMVTPLPDEVFGGQTAKCFKVAMNTGTELGNIESKYCVANNVMVYVKSQSGYGLTEMKAKEVSFTVPDSDFDLPAEPVDLMTGMYGLSEEDMQNMANQYQ